MANTFIIVALLTNEIKKRFKTFADETIPVVNLYRKKIRSSV